MEVFLKLGLAVLLSLAAFAAASLMLARRPGLRVPHLSSRTADRLFYLFSIVYAVTFTVLSILKHESLHTGGYDLGIFDQVVWNSLHGRILQNSIMIDSPLFIGHHFSPILLALVPLYAIWSSVWTLLIFQSVALTFAAFPLYWYARRRLGPDLALALAAAYFLSPSLESVNLWEFHEIAFATPLLSLALFFLFRKRTNPFLVCLGLALLVKEEIAFTAIAFGLYLLFVQRRRWLGAALAIGGGAWSVAVLLYVIPFFRPASYGAAYYFVERYVYLGKTVPEIFYNAVTQPGLVLQHLLVAPKIEFVFQLLVPLAFLPLVGFEVFAMAIPIFAYLLIGDNVWQTSIRFQYTAPLLPFIFFAAVVGLDRLLAWTPSPARLKRYAALGTLVLAAGVVSYLFQAPGPLGGFYDPTLFRLDARTDLAHRLIDSIPPDASVMAEADLASHLTEREYAYQAAVVPDLRKIDYLLANTRHPLHDEYSFVWNDVLQTPFFETVAEQDGFILKKRASVVPQQVVDAHFGDQISLRGYTLESSGQRGGTAQLLLLWRADQSVSQRLKVFIHLVGKDGRLWAQADKEPGNGWFRTDRWTEGDLTPDDYRLGIPSIAPPGEYTVTVGLYDLANQQRVPVRDSSGAVVGTEISLLSLHVGSELAAPSDVSPAIEHPLGKNLGELELLGFAGALGSRSSGDRFDVGLYWKAAVKPTADYRVVLQFLDSAGKVAYEQASRPAGDSYGTEEWSAGETVLDWHTLQVPADLPSGDYSLSVSLRGSGQSSQRVDLGSVHVEKIARLYTASPMAHALDVTFGQAIKLIGYDAERKGSEVHLTLYWKSLSAATTRYTVFVHALDPQGRVVAQADREPANGSRPTTSWLPGEIVPDAYVLTLPSDVAAGAVLELGLYDAATTVRVPITGGTDHIDIPF